MHLWSDVFDSRSQPWPYCWKLKISWNYLESFVKDLHVGFESLCIRETESSKRLQNIVGFMTFLILTFKNKLLLAERRRWDKRTPQISLMRYIKSPFRFLSNSGMTKPCSTVVLSITESFATCYTYLNLFIIVTQSTKIPVEASSSFRWSKISNFGTNLSVCQPVF